MFQAIKRAAKKFGLPVLRPEAINIGKDLDRDELDRISRSIKRGEQDM